jgi:hypothetical protein
MISLTDIKYLLPVAQALKDLTDNLPDDGNQCRVLADVRLVFLNAGIIVHAEVDEDHEGDVTFRAEYV